LIQGQAIVIYERRSGEGDPQAPAGVGIAKLRYIRNVHVWRLYWQKGHERWVSYEPLAENRELKVLVQEVETDPYGAFFG